jgi:hypothetical protein
MGQKPISRRLHGIGGRKDTRLDSGEQKRNQQTEDSAKKS